MANSKPVGVFFEDPDLKTGWAIEGVAVTATAAQLNSSGSASGATAGTVTASKAVVVDSNKDIAAFRNLTATNLDAGASGTAGSVDVFPTTASKGKVAITKTANTNDDTTSFVFGAHAAARTITVPDPGAAANVLMTTGTATATTATTSEISKVAGVPASVTVVVTTPGASGTADAAFTFLDAAGATCAIATAMPFYLSGSTGLAVTAAITSILAADTPVGGVAPLTTGQSGILVTTAAGLGSLKLDGTAATTYYITFIGLGGRLITSPAILTKA